MELNNQPQSNTSPEDQRFPSNVVTLDDKIRFLRDEIYTMENNPPFVEGANTVLDRDIDAIVENMKAALAALEAQL
jgi:hypothetical protein